MTQIYLETRKPGVFNYFLKMVAVLFIVAFFATGANAQVATYYHFSQVNGTYTPITGGTAIATATNHTTSADVSLDQGNYPGTIPFDFNFNGALYNSFNVNANGYITFGTTLPGTTTNTPISTTTAYAGVVAAMARDLWGVYGSVGTRTNASPTITGVTEFTGIAVGKPIRGTGVATGATITAFDISAGTITMSANATSTSTSYMGWPTGEIRVETIGSAPNRICVIQFSGMSDYAVAAPSGHIMDFQIQLAEGAGVAADQTITIVYGPSANLSTTARTQQVGLRGAAATDFNNRSSTTDWTATVAGTSNAATVTRSNTIFPAAGLSYVWSPPVLCSGTPAPGNTLTSASFVCSGVNFNLSLQNNPLVTGLTYQWQSSPDGVQPYTDITSATSATLTKSQLASAYYRCQVTCSGGLFDFSTPVQVITPTGLSGSFTINSAVATGGTNFQTFADAVSAINCGVNGPVVFNVAPLSGPYNEQIILPAISGTSATNTITFKGNGTTLNFNSTASAERAVIKLNGTDYVTIDSFIINSITGTYGFGIQLMNDADHNTIKNCTINIDQASTSTTNFAGIVINSTASAITTTGSSLCDSNTIANNIITGGYAGVALVGNGSTSTINGNKVIGNKIKDFYLYGIYLNGGSRTLLESNDFSRPARSSVSNFSAVYLTGVSTNTQISKNRFHNSFGNSAASTSASFCIYLNSASATAGNETIISNNLIYDIIGSTGNRNGILLNTSSYAKIYHNTIYLNDVAATCSSCAARGIYIQGTTGVGLEFKNNIIAISQGGTASKQCMFFEPTTVTAYALSNNDYYMASTTGTQNEIARTGGSSTVPATGTGYATIAAWKTGSNQEAGSVSEDPLFVNASGGNFKPTSSAINNIATPVGILTDITGAARSTVTPDPGAYEFGVLTAGLNMSAEALLTPALQSSACYTGSEQVTIRIRNNGTGTIDFATDSVTVTVNVTGATTKTLTTVLKTDTLASNVTRDVVMPLTLDMSASGSYTFNASTSVTGDTNPADDAMIPVTRSKAVLSAGTAKATPEGYCVTPGAPSLSATGASGYSSVQWQESYTSGTGFTDIPGATTLAYTLPGAITQTMYYRLVVRCGTALATSAEDTVVLSDPKVTATTPGSTCGPGSVSLGVTGSGLNFNWYDQATGGSKIGTGSTFVTPSINATTTYYVAAAGAGGGSANVGYTSVSGGTSGLGTTNFGIVFDVLSAFTLRSVVIYPVAASAGTAGTVTIDVVDGAGAVVHTETVNVIGNPTGSLVPQRVDLNFNMVPGTNYKLRHNARSTSITGLMFGPSASAPGGNYGYPFTVPGIVTLTTSTLTAPPTNTARADLYYYFYDWIVSTGCESGRTAVIAKVDTPVSATIAYPSSPYCNGTGTAAVSLTGAAGGSYSSTAGLSINSTTGAVNLAASTLGTYTVTYTVPPIGACAAYTTTTTITIASSPSATIAYASPTYCNNAGTAEVIRTGSMGGTFSSTSGLSINASTGEINLAASTGGTYTVTYTIPASGPCLAFSTTTSVTIASSPSAVVTYPGSPYCGGSGTAAVSITGTTGGTFTSTAGLILDASTGLVNLALSTFGTYTVTYTVPASGNCPMFSATASITIGTSPSATITYPGSPYCSNAGTASVNRVGSGGGTYSSTAGLSINASTGDVNLAASTAGTYTVTYTIAAAGACPAVTTTTTITIFAASTATISYAASPYCNAGTATVTLAGTAGGTYSSTAGLSINSTTGAIDLAASTAGTYTVTYTVAAAGGCAAVTSTTPVTIVNSATATIAYPGSPFCTSEGSVAVTHTGDVGGLYSSTTGLVINDVTGIINLTASTAGTYTVTYTIAASAPCPAVTATTTVVVNPSPDGTFTATPTSGLNVSFKATAAPGQSYAWNFGDPTSTANTSALISPVHSFTAAGTYIVTLTVTNLTNLCVTVKEETLDVTSVGVGITNTLAGQFGLKAQPNPFTSNTKISYELPNASEVSLDVFDMLGRKVSTLQKGQYQQAGQYTYDFANTNDTYANGVYFVRLTVDGKTSTLRLIEVK